jgi:DNA-binding FadR family transcriptional regulator
VTGKQSSETASLADKAVHTVTEYMRINRLRAGDMLPGEKYFADAIGVSRAVMREAFGALAALRLIDVGNGRRPKVAEIDGAVMATCLSHALNTAQISLAEIWDVRRTIESRTAGLAASVRTSEEAQEILGLARAIVDHGGSDGNCVELDIAFHQAIATASHNGLFIQLIRSFESLMKMAVPIAWQTRTTKSQCRDVVRNHLIIARAIAKQDTVAAMNAMDAHFDASVRDILTRFPAADAIKLVGASNAMR